MNDQDLKELNGRIRALEIAHAVDTVMIAMNTGERDLERFGAERKEILQGLADGLGNGDDADPELAKALNDLGDLTNDMAKVIAPKWAEKWSK